MGNVDETVVSWGFPWLRNDAEERNLWLQNPDVHIYAGHGYYEDDEQMLQL